MRRHLIRGTFVVGALVAATVCSVPAQADDFINILTGGTGGAYYPIGVALSKVYADKIPGARPTVQATKASVENLTLLQAAKGELALTLGDSLGFAWEGNAEVGFPGKLDKLRGVAAAYLNYIQLVATKDSGIRTLADLKGKRISVGAPKSGTELNTRAVLKAAGMSYADLGKVEYLDFNQSVELMKNRQLDITLQSVGLGGAAIRDLAASIPVTMVVIPADVVNRMGAPFVPATIPAGTYGGQTTDVSTAGVGNFFVTHAGMKTELVYAMTKALFENLETLAAAHSAAKGIALKDALAGMPVPLHPGAEKYYKEKGLLK